MYTYCPKNESHDAKVIIPLPFSETYCSGSSVESEQDDKHANGHLYPFFDFEGESALLGGGAIFDVDHGVREMTLLLYRTENNLAYTRCQDRFDDSIRSHVVVILLLLEARVASHDGHQVKSHGIPNRGNAQLHYTIRKLTTTHLSPEIHSLFT